MCEYEEFDRVECITCSRVMFVTKEADCTECQNCYVTRLELIEKDKQDEKEQDNKIVSIKRVL